MAKLSETEQWLAWLISSDERKWKRATFKLGGLKYSDRVDLVPLITALKSKNVDQVFWSLIALGCLCCRAKRAIPDVIPLVTHRRIGVREAAIDTLSRIGRNDLAAKRAILSSLGDRSPSVRREALQVLINMRNLVAADLVSIRALGADPDEAVASWSEIALRNIELSQRRRSRRAELAVAPERAHRSVRASAEAVVRAR